MDSRMARAAVLKRLREYDRAVTLGEWLGKRLNARPIPLRSVRPAYVPPPESFALTGDQHG